MHTVIQYLCGVILLAGCGGAGYRAPDPIHEDGLLQNQKITIGNELRSFHLYLPNHAASAAIVFLFHGYGGSADQLLGTTGLKAPYKRWMDVARRENLILVVPDGQFGPEKKRGWNDCRIDAPSNPNSADVLFFNRLLDHIVHAYSNGIPRVFAMGTSNGGQMVMRLAEEAPEKLDGIAIVAASRPVNSECQTSTKALSVLVMNGTNDPILPFQGGQIASRRGEVFSAMQTINHWVNRNGAEVRPVRTAVPNINKRDRSHIRRMSHSNGVDGSRVEFYEVVNGGHTEPSIRERYSRIYKSIVGNQNRDLEMAEEVWDFFKSL